MGINNAALAPVNVYRHLSKRGDVLRLSLGNPLSLFLTPLKPCITASSASNRYIKTGRRKRTEYGRERPVGHTQEASLDCRIIQ